MAVANKQIQEVLILLRKYITRHETGLLLAELKDTEAYHWNKSFKETVDRLEQANVGVR